MTIGIFGGSFNPIHNGHLQIAQNLLDLKIVDEVWLLPCFSHVWNKELISPEHRTKMIDLALSDSSGVVLSEVEGTPPRWHDGIKICNLEILQKKSIFTIDTVKILLKKYPQHNFIWLLGSDSFKTLPKWHKINELLNIIPLIIVPRIDDNYSSTIIRDRLNQGLSIKKLVPSKVEEYIFEKKLYNTP